MIIEDLNNNEKFGTLRNKINNNFIQLKNQIQEYVSTDSLNLYTINDKDSLFNVRNKINYNFLKIYQFLVSI